MKRTLLLAVLLLSACSPYPYQCAVRVVGRDALGTMYVIQACELMPIEATQDQ